MATRKANSNLLKEAIADARTVRETALKNAELAIQEALTPRLQSIISRKIQAEMEEDDDVDVLENDESSGIGVMDDEPNEYTNTAQTELGPDTEEETEPVGEEDDEVEVVYEMEDDKMESTYNVSEDDYMEMDTDEMDLEEIIRELESELEKNEMEMNSEEEDEDEDEFNTNMDMENGEEEFELDLEDDDEMEMEVEDQMEEDDEMEEDNHDSVDTFDLEEILREMGYDDDEEEVTEKEEDRTNELESELNEAYKTIKFLKGTINEVNLLNAKLLFANKVFRQYNLTTEQKVKIVESFDRTSSVREVKLVFATISESMKLTGTQRIKKITEGFASNVTKSTAPKKIINENVDFSMDEFQKRNQELAGIIRK